MTPEQALALLDQVTSLLTLNRADHGKVIQALEALKKFHVERKEASVS